MSSENVKRGEKERNLPHALQSDLGPSGPCRSQLGCISHEYEIDTAWMTTYLSPFRGIDRSTITTNKFSFFHPDLLLLLFSSRITLDSIRTDSDTECAVGVRR